MIEFEKLLLLALRRLAAYHRYMSIILRQGDMEVEKVVTPSGVTGYIATSVGGSAIDAMIGKLEARIKAHEAGQLEVNDNGEFVVIQAATPNGQGPSKQHL